mmetsp:Transcript_55849/g.169989  ORF Transcript_55849/g.169989 Transcript_55849/m.169989 type:complete len:363 (+) Transcript_55849:101-1189(+)
MPSLHSAGFCKATRLALADSRRRGQHATRVERLRKRRGRRRRGEGALRRHAGLAAQQQRGGLHCAAGTDLRERILVHRAAAGQAKGVEGPPAARLAGDPGDDQAAPVARVPQGIPAELGSAGIVNHAAIRLGDLLEAPVRRVDVDAEGHLLHLGADAVQVDDDLLVVALALAREIVPGVLDAVRRGLQSAEEHRLEVLAVPVQQHRRDVQVDLAVVHVPTQADGDLPHVDGQVQHTAFLHRESDLLPRGGLRDERPDDLGERRQNVHEVPPALGGHVDFAQPPAGGSADHGRHDVYRAGAPLHGEACHLLVLPLLEEDQLPVGHILQGAARVRSDDEHQEVHVLRQSPQICPHDFLDVTRLA